MSRMCLYYIREPERARSIWESAFNSFSTEQTEIDFIDLPVITLDSALANLHPTSGFLEVRRRRI